MQSSFYEGDGMETDDWKIDNKGNIISHTEGGDFDQVHIVDDNGSIRASSCQYKLSTLSEFNISNCEMTSFIVCGNENADELFEFFAENFTMDVGYPIEWAHNVATDGTNFVGTTHESSRNGCREELEKNGYSIKESSHNHPNGCPIPSMFVFDSRNHGDLNISELNPHTTFYTYTTQNGYTKYKNGQILDTQLLELMPAGQMDCTHIMKCLPWRNK